MAARNFTTQSLRVGKSFKLNERLRGKLNSIIINKII